LFASDGLHDLLEPADIADALASADTPAIIAQRLVDQALTRGGPDNITALVVQYRP
jgi:protein phosphatase